MLEWLSSKLPVVLASLLMLSSMFAYFAQQYSDTQFYELREVVTNLANFIDEFIDLPWDITFKVSSQQDADFIIPSGIHGRPYHIHLRRDSVIAELDHSTVVGHWSGNLHFWRWNGLSLDLETLTMKDDECSSLSLTSGQSFSLTIVTVKVDYEEVSLAFALLD